MKMPPELMEAEAGQRSKEALDLSLRVLTSIFYCGTCDPCDEFELREIARALGCSADSMDALARLIIQREVQTNAARSQK